MSLLQHGQKWKKKELPGTIYKTVEEIQTLGRQALPLKCGVTDETSVHEMVKKTILEFGKIDILVNNAGVASYYPVVEMPLRRWELVLKANLTGAFLCTKAVLPKMIEQRRGSIINISSLAANERDGAMVSTGLAYGVAKAGLDRFTWGLAAEVGKFNIAVNCLKPQHVVDTEGMRFWVKEEERKDWVSPEKMVKCALFLAQQDASGVTGTVATDEELCAWHGL
jgi:citronellol/citronellal dehydrogenase